MVATPDGLYQDAENLADPSNHLKEKFGIVIGSGRHGQTYLYWDEDELYELPVSLDVGPSMGPQPRISCRANPL